MKPVAIVTGANSGIGKEVAAGLMERDHKVILACRRMEACCTVQEELLAQQLPGTCECRHLDLDNFNSIRAFSQGFLQDHPGQQLKVLVNNASVMGVSLRPDTKEDGHLRPNHFGPFFLTRLIMPALAQHARIVTVGSESHYRSSMQFEIEPSTGNYKMSPPPWNWYFQYGRSKLANALMTAELTRKLNARSSTVTACCVSPGRVNTSIFNNIPGGLASPVKILASLVFQTPKQGAETVLLGATAPTLEAKYVPLYLHDMKEKRPSAAAQDPELADKLWKLSVRTTGLTTEEDEALWPIH